MKKAREIVMKRIIDPTWAWMNRHKMFCIFTSGVLIDFWANWYSYAINHDWIVLQAFLGFFLPLMNFPFMVWFFDEKQHSERFKYCLCGAISMTIGSTVMLLMVREGWIAGTAY